MSEKFSVVLTGKLAGGYELPQVKENIASVFKLAPEKVDKLFSGRPVALKRGVDKAQAMKLRNALARAGALGVIKADAPVQDKGPEPAQDQPVLAEVPVAPAQNAEAPAAKPAAAQQPDVTCPRCGHQQEHTSSCGLCKMDLTLHLKRMQRRELMAANRRQLKSQASN